MRLNLACGPTRWDGFDNSDILRAEGTSFVDLESFPYPYANESAELIMMSHALFMTTDGVTPAHPDPTRIFRECYRILKLGGWLRIDDNPWRCYSESESPPDESELAAAYPDELRLPRERLVDTLLGVGFYSVAEIDPTETAIMLDASARSAIVGNHGWHVSFAVEALK